MTNLNIEDAKITIYFWSLKQPVSAPLWKIIGLKVNESATLKHCWKWVRTRHWVWDKFGSPTCLRESFHCRLTRFQPLSLFCSKEFKRSDVPVLSAYIFSYFETQLSFVFLCVRNRSHIVCDVIYCGGQNQHIGWLQKRVRFLISLFCKNGVSYINNPIQTVKIVSWKLYCASFTLYSNLKKVYVIMRSRVYLDNDNVFKYAKKITFTWHNWILKWLWAEDFAWTDGRRDRKVLKWRPRAGKRQGDCCGNPLDRSSALSADVAIFRLKLCW